MYFRLLSLQLMYFQKTTTTRKPTSHQTRKPNPNSGIFLYVLKQKYGCTKMKAEKIEVQTTKFKHTRLSAFSGYLFM